jgi:protein ImuB
VALAPDGPPARFHWRRKTHDVLRAEGPERIAPDWRMQGLEAPERDYYRVEDVEGRRFWLFRHGLYERGEGAPRWFIHGLFA